MLRPINPSYTLAGIMCVFLCRSALFREEVILLPPLVFEPPTPSNNPVTLLTLSTEIARVNHSNDNNSTEEQTYRIFCNSVTFPQTRPCTYRTELFIRLSYVILYEISIINYFFSLNFNLIITDIIAWQRPRNSQKAQFFPPAATTYCLLLFE
jgi:hypothetical protein